MTLLIRPLKDAEDGRLIEEMMVVAWDSDHRDSVPGHLSVALAKENGGVILLAFVAGVAAGFCWGFWSWDRERKQWKCASHLAAVVPEFRGYKIGEQLKWAQRQAVLDNGFDLMTWTFDPLETRNAALNFRKLGAINNEYHRNLYGKIDLPLEREISTDRFVATWHLESADVVARASGEFVQPTWSSLVENGALFVNTVKMVNELPRPAVASEHLIAQVDSNPLLVAVPRDFYGIKKQDMELAKAWRLHTRHLFEAAFTAGYTAVNLLPHDEEENLCVYLLHDLR